MTPEAALNSAAVKAAAPLVEPSATASAIEPVKALLDRVKVKGAVPVAEVKR